MRAFLSAALSAAWLIAGAGAAHAMPKPVLPAAVVVPPFPAGASTQPLNLVRAVLAVPDGQVWRYIGGDPPCSFDGVDVRWSSNSSEINVERLRPIFSEELALSGLSAKRTENLFEEDRSSDGLQVAAKIDNIQSYVCGRIFGSAHEIMLIDVEWQIYDPLKREIIGRVRTKAGVDQDVSTDADLGLALFPAFRENVRALLADNGFRQIVTAGGATNSPLQEQERSPIRVAVASPGATRPIGEVSASVVALFTGDGMGSGFLVSDDGYILTNQHVVGSATKVRVRWSDGLETTGEVVRSDKRRDVALVKTEPRGRPPLALVRGNPTVGSAVYAVGTPLDQMLQNTVTRGIVSANRFIEGFAYIQSDVSIDHGNSGGPLLDEKGRVIGITVIKIAPDDGQRNLNLFIPIGDALDFLALKTGG
jgi:serine protease Do